MRKIKTYFFYILRCTDGSLYCGIAVDLKRRVLEHNFMRLGAKYTRSRRPVKLIYSKKFLNRSAALKEEYKIKKLSRTAKIEMIKKNRKNF